MFDDLQGLVSIDLETRDPDLKTKGPGWFPGGEGYVVGVAVADENGAHYYPIRHELGENHDPKRVFGWLTKQLARDGLEVAFANATYDLGWLRREGVIGQRWNFEAHDVQYQAPLLDEYRPTYRLDFLAKEYLGMGKDETSLRAAATDFGLKDVKSELWKLPGDAVATYAEQDARATRNLFRELRRQMDREVGLTDVYELERSLIPMLIDMRWNGVRVDVRRAEKLRREYRAKHREALDRLAKHAGFAVDEWSAESVAKALKADGIVPPLTAQTRPSVTADLLKEWTGRGSVIAREVLTARKYQKAAATFIENSILGHLGKDDRIRGEFHPLRSDDGGTITGRFSSSNPNLQQLPVRDEEIGPEVRALFLPEEGRQWCSVDYSAQEPRLTVHYAGLLKVPGGESAVEAYQANPRLDYHQMVADMCGIDRKSAKTINLGLAYGMGGAKLCDSLGLPTEEVEIKGVMRRVAGPEGKALLEKYHERAPFIRGLMDATQRAARVRGYIKTLSGRRCRFPLKNGERWFVHKALNKLIQGSAADQMKMAMRDCWAAGEVPMLTVHDELCFSVTDADHAARLGEIMRNAAPISVPMEVDIEIGPTWGEAE